MSGQLSQISAPGRVTRNNSAKSGMTSDSMSRCSITCWLTTASKLRSTQGSGAARSTSNSEPATSTFNQPGMRRRPQPRCSRGWSGADLIFQPERSRAINLRRSNFSPARVRREKSRRKWDFMGCAPPSGRLVIQQPSPRRLQVECPAVTTTSRRRDVHCGLVKPCLQPRNLPAADHLLIDVLGRRAEEFRAVPLWPKHLCPSASPDFRAISRLPVVQFRDIFLLQARRSQGIRPAGRVPSARRRPAAPGCVVRAAIRAGTAGRTGGRRALHRARTSDCAARVVRAPQ